MDVVQGATVSRSDGFVELLNARYEPIGSRQPCRFDWEVTPAAANVSLVSDHDIVVSASEGAVAYVALRDTDGALLFMLRVPDRIAGNGIFGIGPHRSGFVKYRRVMH